MRTDDPHINIGVAVIVWIEKQLERFEARMRCIDDWPRYNINCDTRFPGQWLALAALLGSG